MDVLSKQGVTRVTKGTTPQICNSFANHSHFYYILQTIRKLARSKCIARRSKTAKFCENRGKVEYKTQTRQKIMDYMAENPDRIFKASEIAKSLPEVSLSTIYRNLSRMEKAGVVQIVGADDNNELRYRYTGPGQCEEKMHLVCKECGKFFHLEGPALKVLQLSVQRSGFELDQQQSVLLGRCSGCSRRRHG